MKPFEIRPLSKDDRDWVAGFLEERWGSPEIVTRGRLHRADELPGFAAVADDRPVGLVTYRVEGGECEIVSLYSVVEGAGIGTALVDAVKTLAVYVPCKRLWLVTMNDNVAALRFFQKRGYRLVAVYRDALDESRKLKPEIPLIGRDGIPLRDEIELELLL
jgi:ribosomal protein S18 acetylase RimI-like enzyme